MKLARLDDRALIRVSGPDALHFLQNLVTGEVEDMAEGDLSFAALLTPQGKILFDFMVVRENGACLLDVAADRADELAKRLAFYKLRAKVDVVKLADGTEVMAAWDHGQERIDGKPDPRLAAMGVRLYGQSLAQPDASLADYHRHRIGLGVPAGGLDFGWGEAFPHEALMDRIGGVDFRKGCYVGQEVVSRMQHRGTARSRIIRVTGDGALPAAGTTVEAGGKTMGTMGSSAGTQGLALLRLDRVAAARAAGDALSAAGVTLEAEIQSWAGLDWPEG